MPPSSQANPRLTRSKVRLHIQNMRMLQSGQKTASTLSSAKNGMSRPMGFARTPSPKKNMIPSSAQKSANKDRERQREELLSKINVKQDDATSKREEMRRQKIEEQRLRREEREKKVAKQLEQQRATKEAKLREIEQREKELEKLRAQQAGGGTKKGGAAVIQPGSPEGYSSSDDQQRRPHDHEEMRKKAAETARFEREKAEMARLAQMEKERQQTAKKTATAPKSANKSSYDITMDTVPEIEEPASQDNYGLDDLKSGDETDEEDRPRKRVPLWASGAQLRAALVQQHYNPPDLERLFPYIRNPDLEKIFNAKRARFNKRTSSAIWDSPLGPIIAGGGSASKMARC